MKILYTDTLALTSEGLLIRRTAETSGDGNLPMLRLKGLQLIPTNTDVDYYIKGIDISSEWVLMRRGTSFYLDLDDDSFDICYVKSDGSVSLSLIAAG